MIKKIVIGTLLSFASLYISAQVGITTTFRYNNAPQWELEQVESSSSIFTNTDLLGNGFSLGLDYSFRLNNQRISFLPEFNYGSYQRYDVDVTNLERMNKLYSLFLNTNVYFLDLNDCNCSTFSNLGNFFKKGLFIQISPGYTIFRQEIDLIEFAPTTYTNGAFSIGGALGLDVGVSDWVTLSFLAGLRYFPLVTWEGFTTNSIQVDEFLVLKSEETDITQTFLGLRLGIRLDGNE